jgi:hypothetical protein
MAIGDTNRHERRRGALTRTTLYLLFGPIVWAVHFAMLYGMHTILCARPSARVMPGAGVATIVLAATVAALALLLAATVTGYRRRNAAHADSRAATRFCHDVMVLLTLLSACGVVWAGATALLVAPCVGLR